MDKNIQNLKERLEQFLKSRQYIIRPSGKIWIEERIAALSEELNMAIRQQSESQQQWTNFTNRCPWQYWTEPIELQSAQHFRVFQATPTEWADVQNLDQAMGALVSDISPTLVRLCEQFKCLKIWPSLHVRYESANPLANPFLYGDAHLPAVHSIFHRCPPYTEEPYKAEMERFAEAIKISNAKFIRDGSGFILAEIYSLNFNIVKFNPLSGLGWSELPKFIQKKEAIVNVKNEDNKCFAYAIASALHPVDRQQHPSRPNQYLQYFTRHG